MEQNKFVFARQTPSAAVGYPSPGSTRAAFSRFVKNRASPVAAGIILLLLLLSLAVPLLSPYGVDFRDGYLRSLPPIFCRNITLSGSQAVLDYYSSMDAVRQVTLRQETAAGTYYRLKVDALERVGYLYVDLSPEEYLALQAYQNSTGIQVCYPLPKNYTTFYPAVKSSANLWYELEDPSLYSTGASAHHDSDGNPIFVPNYLSAQPDGSYTSLRLSDDPGTWVYGCKNQTGYRCRVLYRVYYRYCNGFSPGYLLGTDQHGRDILVCLASGGRLSFLLAFSVSVINLFLGLLYGAVEGYYGGKLDLFLERIADILSAVPFIVVATLFQLHLAQRTGVVGSLLFSFVLTGWIGIAGRTRTQFYRFKNTEYVLCARTLGATDRRIILRHILPNALGTIITSAVLLIPGVIFSESMLSYLGIVNLDAGKITSLGTMLAGGRAYLSTYPHILIFPAVFIALLEISFNLLGNGLRDALNPLLKEN